MLKFTSKENETGSAIMKRFKIAFIKHAYNTVGDYRADVARYCGMNVKTVFNWVHKYEELKDYRSDRGCNASTLTRYDKKELWKTKEV